MKGRRHSKCLDMLALDAKGTSKAQLEGITLQFFQNTGNS